MSLDRMVPDRGPTARGCRWRNALGTACCALLVLLTIPVPQARADVALLLASPYGRPGGFNPTGHVGVYLTRVCAATPTTLRRCQPGEAGVVISRYNRVAELDWVAIPLVPYLYAVERAEDVPSYATEVAVADLRDRYRRAHLRGLAPDGPSASGAPVDTHWRQLIGAVYDRQIVAFSIATTPAQDDALIAHLNRAPNRRRFNLFFRNCADFARDIINRYYPGAIRSSFIADLGFTTPKQVAKALARFGARQPDAAVTAFMIPQIPGNRPDSGRPRGVLEGLLKTKKYSVPLAIAQPWVPVGLAAGYMAAGRFDPFRNTAPRVLDPVELERQARQAAAGVASGDQHSGISVSDDDALECATCITTPVSLAPRAAGSLPLEDSPPPP